jgi:two-component system cell cycle sensor histidine kinase/response regulator CckA
MKTRQNFVRIITYLSASIILLLVIIPPLVCFCISYQHMVGSIETEGAISTITIMKIISLDPKEWEFKEDRLQDVLSSYPRKGFDEKWRILNAKNEVITESASRVDKPFIVRSFKLMDSGVNAGRLEISRSIRPLFIKALTITLFMLPLGAGAFLVLFYLPIRTLYRSDKALTKSKQMLEKTFASLREAIFIIDYQTGKIIDCNPSATEIFSYKREEILGQTMDFLHIGAKESKLFSVLLDSSVTEKGFLFLPEFAMKRKDGTVFPAEHSMFPLEDEQKNMIGWVSVVRDITHRKIIEEELSRAQKFESLGLLASGIAHDFNNLMTGVLGNISLIKSCPVRPEKTCEIPKNMEQAALRTRDLIRQLLTFSKGRSPDKKVASIVELTQESASFALSGSNVKCQFSIPDNISAVKVDEGQMSQVINNVVINAIQVMPEGGLIEIQFKNITVAKNNVIGLGEGEYVQISIKDHGIGIPKGDLPKIFDPYFTTRQGGTGLGLATAYSIIKNHDGLITVESEVGVGTTFHIYLPTTKEKFMPHTTQVETYLNGKGSILLMDDKQVVRDAAKWMLGRIGYKVVCAGDGSEAVAMYKEALQSGKPFDAVILDLTVPGGMGGKEAVAELLEFDPNVKAIVSSGYSEDTVMSEFKQYGFKGMLEKPYRIEELNKTLSKVIEMKS